jgi:hypothetical protein
MKNIIVLLLSSLILNCAKAQSQSLQVYANNGVNLSNFVDISGEGARDRSWKISYRYGIGIKYNINSKWSIGAECNREEKGWLENNTGVWTPSSPWLLVSGEKNFVYSYVSFPVFVSYNKQYKKNAYFFESGISTNKLIRNKSIIKTKAGTDGNVANLFYPQDGSPYDFSWINGIGIRRDINDRFNLFFNFRYSLSFTKMGSWGVQKCCFRHQNFSTLLGVAYN